MSRLSLCLALGAFLVAVGGQQYSDKFASVDLDKILKDPATYDKYLKCLKSTGDCTPEGQALKTILPEALASGCAKCSAEQKAKARKVLLFLLEKKPDDYSALEKIYDPSGSARARLQKSG
ncbi:hypothetical protein AAG570_012185 [Ranatra chinensis]|uniref:Uncharacterized protein n=1 Tax=Ranatra chinensis TaxID=642074 RepID=A0ABD0YIF7_9HEMI